MTRFRASQGARSLGPATPRPASGLGRSQPPYTFPRVPASRTGSRAAGPAPPRPAPLCCTAVPTAPPPRRAVTS